MTTHALIYTHTITPRLQYIVGFLSEYYRLEFALTSSEERYKASSVPCKINYSYHRLTREEIWLHPHVLLFESSVRQVKVECFQTDKFIAFFKTDSDFGFDLFAAIFYLLVRYEEYLPYEKDRYGRFAHDNSIAFKEGFLQT